MNFAVNNDVLTELINNIKSGATTLRSNIEGVYNSIGGFQSSWDGPAYTAFKERCDAFRPALDEVADIIEAYATYLENIQTNEVSTLFTEVDNAFSIL